MTIWWGVLKDESKIVYDSSMNIKYLYGGIAAVVIILCAGLIAFIATYQTESQQTNKVSVVAPTSTAVQASVQSAAANNATRAAKPTSDSDEPPLLIKSMPITLAQYDPKTNKAGDLQFTKQKLNFDLLFSDYGFYIPASSAGAAKKNPQPTFVVPLGTKVRSIVDGVVIDMPTLWSGDISIMVGTSSASQFRYETEHVIRPVVKVGDTVKAGQVIAEVSDYDSKNNPGFGLVEMGILRGGNPPTHVCPFAYLDSSIKEQTYSQLRSFYTAWNAYLGKTVYKTTRYKVPGCLTFDEIEG